MTYSVLQEFKPSILQHTYWYKKTDFLLEKDHYPNWVIFAVESGRFSFQISEQSGEASFGDLVICPPGIDFHRKILTTLTFHFLQFRCSEQTILPIGMISIKDANRLSSTYSYLRMSENHTNSVTMDWKNHLLLDILKQYNFETHAPTLTISEKLNDTLLNDALQFLKENSSKPVRIETLAKTLGLSPVQFTRKFKSYTGITPTEFLTNLRLLKARKLLLETDLTLDNIAVECGYQSGFYLSRIFSKNYNMSPSNFRKTYRI